jgi:adenylate cyclase
MGPSVAHGKDDREAWIESADGQVWSLDAGCSIGRATTNQIVLGDGRVSRRHAIVHRQDSAEYWLVDLGSGNGTFVNGLRVALPTRLNDCDTVMVGATLLTFRQTAIASASRTPASSSHLTQIEVKATTCWMLVADIVGSTRLAAKYDPKRWATLVGGWAGECHNVLEGHGGLINKYLGDGFLALWPREGQPTQPVKKALDAFLSMQKNPQLPFRMAVHYGDVMMGGGRSLGEDSLSGLDLVLLFRMEQIAGRLNRLFLCSTSSSSSPVSTPSLEWTTAAPVASSA